MLRHDVLEALSLGQAALAAALGVPQTRISAIVNRRRSVPPDTALRLGRSVGTSPEFWLGMQSTYDLEIARDKRGAAIEASVSPRAA